MMFNVIMLGKHLDAFHFLQDVEICPIFIELSLSTYLDIFKGELEKSP